MNLKKFKKLSGDASFRQFFRTDNSVLVYSKIQKRSNLLNYDAVNRILIKNKILAPGLISQNYKKNFSFKIDQKLWQSPAPIFKIKSPFWVNS